jgi:lipopolysaccharide transport system permease protein
MHKTMRGKPLQSLWYVFSPFTRLRLIKDLYAYRGFISSCVKREFQTKYKNSLFGLAWNIINPMSMIFVYTVIFSQVMRAKLPGVDTSFAYSIYLCAGVLTWGFFAEITTRSQTMFIDNANLLKKIRFPKICLPASVVATATLNFVIIFSIFSSFLIVSGNGPGLAYFAIFPLLLLLVMFSVGIGMILGMLNVFFRDVGHFFGIAITFWFWLTPIIYPPDILPPWVQHLIALNPMSAFMSAVQGILVRGQLPAWDSLNYMLISAIVLNLLGFRLFRQHSFEMVDEL